MRVNLDDDIPVVCPTRQLPYGHIEAANQIVKDYLRRGIIEYSQSTYKSPGFLVKKVKRKILLSCRLH